MSFDVCIVFYFQPNSSDFPGNYVGYDDSWNHEKFVEVLHFSFISILIPLLVGMLDQKLKLLISVPNSY